MQMSEMAKKIEKIFWVLEQISFELMSLNTHFYGETEYLSSEGNTLRNRIKISDTTQTEYFELNFFQVDRKI